MKYCSLHNHTEYSNLRGFLDAITRPDELVEKAFKVGYKGIAITDHDVLSCHSDERLLSAIEKIKQQDPEFKLIYGNEIYLISGENYKECPKFFHFILLAKDKIGHRQLRELSSRAWDRSFTSSGITRTPTFYKDIEEVVGKEKGHIIASSACFTKGHKVYTKQGWEKIENFVGGEEVLTHDGSWQKVISPTYRDYQGEGRHLSFRRNSQEITCTNTHKFLLPCETYNATKKCNEVKKLKWVEAKYLKEGDKCLFPFSGIEYSSLAFIEGDKYLRKCRDTLGPQARVRYKIKDKIPITPELMRLFGLWLGEGSVSGVESCGKKWTLSFNIVDYPLYKDFVMQGLSALGNFHVTTRFPKDSNKVEMSIGSAELVELFGGLFGREGAEYKSIPRELMHISPEMDAEILYGYLLADGYCRCRKMGGGKYFSNETVSATISASLNLDIEELYRSLGFVPSAYIVDAHKGADGVNHKCAYYLTCSNGFFSKDINKSQKLTHKEMWAILQKQIERHSKSRTLVFEGQRYLISSVKKNEPIELNERVYCLNVEKNHSFVCNGVVVHNCLGSEVAQCILSKNSDRLNEFVNWCVNVFGKENFFFEMQAAISEEQQTVNKYILQLSEYFEIPYIITDDTHYLDKEDFDIHSAYLNSRGSGDRETELFYKYTYLKSPEEIIELLSPTMTVEQITKGLENSELIYGQIQDYSLQETIKVPYRDPPPFELQDMLVPYYDKYEYIKLFANSEYVQDRYLLYLIENGIVDKKWPLDEEHLGRINTELEQLWVISDKIGQRLSSYFELVRDIVHIGWEVGSTVGVSRGSCSGEVITYLIDIIQVNGLKYDLPYWRFLNKERTELPDVDLDFDPFYKEKIMERVKEYYGEDNVLNTITYKTESTKSAILTSARGMGIPVEEAQVLSNMVPQVRGKVLALDVCLKGDEDNSPVNGFQEALNKFPGLEKMIRKIEGIISGRGVHASSVYIFNNGYLAQNSLMRAPNGLKITAFNMHQSDSMGGLKMDFLYTEAQSKINACLKLLLEDGLIEWQGTLYDTYRKYLHPDVLEYDDKEMWAKVGKNEIPDLFQFDTQVGLECARKVKPENLIELTLANSVMRLMGEGERPIDRFVRFKNNINEWYDEMEKEGLTKEEQELAKKVLGQSYGCSIEQETLMIGAMEIAGFSLKEANALRKVISKKITKKIPEMKELFLKNAD